MVYSLEYTRSYLFSWTRYGTQRNDHSSWNLFNLTAVIESTLMLEYTRLARRLIGFIVEIHREAGLARATHCARALLPQKNQRPVIGMSNLAAPFRFRSQWLIAGRGRASCRSGHVWRANAIRIFTLSEAVRRLIALSVARDNKDGH